MGLGSCVRDREPPIVLRLQATPSQTLAPPDPDTEAATAAAEAAAQRQATRTRSGSRSASGETLGAGAGTKTGTAGGRGREHGGFCCLWWLGGRVRLEALGVARDVGVGVVRCECGRGRVSEQLGVPAKQLRVPAAERRLPAPAAATPTAAGAAAGRRRRRCAMGSQRSQCCDGCGRCSKNGRESHGSDGRRFEENELLGE